MPGCYKEALKMCKQTTFWKEQFIIFASRISGCWLAMEKGNNDE